MFGIASLATFLAFLDTTIVNVAFPDLLGDFPGAGLDTLAWVINGYALLFAALLAVAGRTADLVGRKRVFLGGIALFVLGSAAAGLAPSPGALIAARLAQGAAAAAMVPSALALLLPGFPPARRASVVGLWGGVAGIAAALGPVLGGVLVDLAGWRLVFALNVPVGLVALALGRRLLAESRAEDDSVRPDVAGAILLAGATGLLALGLLQANSWGWADPRTLGVWALAVVLAVALAVRSRRPSGAHRRDRALARALVRGGQRRAVRVRRRVPRRAAGRRTVPDRRLGLLDARGRPRARARPAGRRHRGRDRRPDRRPGRAARGRAPGHGHLRRGTRLAGARARQLAGSARRVASRPGALGCRRRPRAARAHQRRRALAAAPALRHRHGDEPDLAPAGDRARHRGRSSR